MRWRYRIARWFLPELDSYIRIEPPYRAAVVLLPPDESWTEEDINSLTAALEAETGHRVAVSMFFESFLVDIRRARP